MNPDSIQTSTEVIIILLSALSIICASYIGLRLFLYLLPGELDDDKILLHNSKPTAKLTNVEEPIPRDSPNCVNCGSSNNRSSNKCRYCGSYL